jgi:hypothetical protein
LRRLPAHRRPVPLVISIRAIAPIGTTFSTPVKAVPRGDTVVGATFGLLVVVDGSTVVGATVGDFVVVVVVGTVVVVLVDVVVGTVVVVLVDVVVGTVVVVLVLVVVVVVVGTVVVVDGPSRQWLSCNPGFPVPRFPTYATDAVTAPVSGVVESADHDPLPLCCIV